jgi:hypothetical protein
VHRQGPVFGVANEMLEYFIKSSFVMPEPGKSTFSSFVVLTVNCPSFNLSFLFSNLLPCHSAKNPSTPRVPS